MTSGGKIAEKVRKINCASLPPCQKTLEQHILRANYISILWTRAGTRDPTDGIHPLSYGWVNNNGHFLPLWFEGNALPTSLTTCEMESVDNESVTEHGLLDVYEADTDIDSDKDEGDDDIYSHIEFDTLESDTAWTSDSESCSGDDCDDLHD